MRAVISASLQRELADRLQQQAVEEKAPVSRIIAKALESYLEREREPRRKTKEPVET